MGFGGETPCIAGDDSKLDERNKALDLREEIRERREEWHKRKAAVERLLEEPVQLAREDPASGIAALFTLTKCVRRMYRRCLRSRFGYRVWATDYPFLEHGALKPERIIKPGRLPRNIVEEKSFTTVLTEWVASRSTCTR